MAFNLRQLSSKLNSFNWYSIIISGLIISWPLITNLFLKNASSYQAGKWLPWATFIINPLQLILFGLLTWRLTKTKNLLLVLANLGLGLVLLSLSFAQPETSTSNLILILHLLIFSFFSTNNIKQNYKLITSAVVFVLISQTLLATGQFIGQHDLGLQFLNEPELTTQIKGVAKLALPIWNSEVIRAYGTFAHPNILSTIISLCLLYLLFSPHLNRQQKLAITAIATIGLLTALSRNSIYLVAILALISFLPQYRQKFRLSPTHLVIIAITVIIIFGIRSFSPHTTLSNQARINQIQRLTITEQTKQLPWQQQPVHNIYLYLWQNYHLLAPLILLIWLLAIHFQRQKQLTPTILLLLLVGLTDHFLLTLPIANYAFLLASLSMPSPNIPAHTDAC